MTIQRFGTTSRWSDAVICNGSLYTVEVANTLSADIATQSQEVLANLQTTLEKHLSDKSRLLMCTIYLDDIRDIDAFNAVWDVWVPAGTAPVRACVQARLAKSAYRVEVQAIAAVNA